MKKTALVTITNLHGYPKSMKVQNFSDKNVKEVISKLMDIKAKDLQCQSASTGGGIYSLKKHYRGIKEELRPIGLTIGKNEVFIQVSYGDLYE